MKSQQIMIVSDCSACINHFKIILILHISQLLIPHFPFFSFCMLFLGYFATINYSSIVNTEKARNIKH